MSKGTYSVRLYLDACCFTRSFDDQAVDLETEAVLTILRHVKSREGSMISSGFLKQAKRLTTVLTVRVVNPLDWIKEVLDHDNRRNDS